MSGTADYVAKMEMTLLPNLEPGQVWLTRGIGALTAPAFVLIGPRPDEDSRWEGAPYDILRTRFEVGRIVPLPQGAFAEIDLNGIGQSFLKLRTSGRMPQTYWTKHLFTVRNQPLLYEKLFAFTPWGENV